MGKKEIDQFHEEDKKLTRRLTSKRTRTEVYYQECPQLTENSGKWLVYCYADELIKTWKKIANATEKGKLGWYSKVMSEGGPHGVNPNVGVICVATYDSEDKDYVARIAWRLRKLGVVPKGVLNYKKDITSIEGKYAVKGDTKISHYSVSCHHFKNKTKKQFITFFKERFK
jgi:hypothetical protein